MRDPHRRALVCSSRTPVLRSKAAAFPGRTPPPAMIVMRPADCATSPAITAAPCHRGVCWGSDFLTCVQGYKETLRPSTWLSCVPLSCVMRGDMCNCKRMGLSLWWNHVLRGSNSTCSQKHLQTKGDRCMQWHSAGTHMLRTSSALAWPPLVSTRRTPHRMSCSSAALQRSRLTCHRHMFRAWK